jgi:hypothetical protein
MPKGRYYRTQAPCGTRAKYLWHRKRGEDCLPCRLAANEYTREHLRQRNSSDYQENPMTYQLELFANKIETSCRHPRLKRSSAYAYGCRCDDCVTTYLERSKQFLREKREARQCDLCKEKLLGTAIYPVCHKCRTPFIERTRLLRVLWSQVLVWIERSSCGICGCQFDMSRAGGPGSWQIDHDHSQGERPDRYNYRDVLCGPCNSGIGALEANIRRGLITEVKGPFGDYLARHQSTPPTSDT